MAVDNQGLSDRVAAGEVSREFLVDRALLRQGHILSHELRRNEPEKGPVVAMRHLARAGEVIHGPDLHLPDERCRLGLQGNNRGLEGQGVQLIELTCQIASRNRQSLLATSNHLAHSLARRLK
jgi:hypothetical protein